MSELWDKIWEREHQDWDSLSAEIMGILKKEITCIKGKKILEAGSGSGRISLRLALMGAEITLLDYSEKALALSGGHFQKYGVPVTLVKADLTEKLPFADNAFDIVWNSGVMEHFDRQEQGKISREISRVAWEFHTFNPYAGSIFYRLGKWAAERNGSWPYGRELPVQTMKDVFSGAGYELQAEYPIAPFAALDFTAFLGNNTGELLRLFLAELAEDEKKDMMQRMGGYLLYSKGKRE